jgi:hypothetical protein
MSKRLLTSTARDNAFSSPVPPTEYVPHFRPGTWGASLDGTANISIHDHVLIGL